mmetsp:Transcript_50647/g.122212  ORF Transcript_50647/g.122212 Transcript_50647/m.122212 type:complete len:81 (-) Transcript_50647:622-864(-)
MTNFVTDFFALTCSIFKKFGCGQSNNKFMTSWIMQKFENKRDVGSAKYSRTNNREADINDISSSIRHAYSVMIHPSCVIS